MIDCKKNYLFDSVFGEYMFKNLKTKWIVLEVSESYMLNQTGIGLIVQKFQRTLGNEMALTAATKE